jgi:putative DNA primase/helicase
MLYRPGIRDITQGRWRGILASLGLTEKQLSSKHTECPICRNGPRSDSFRFDDKDGRGTWICTHCGAGEGISLVMKIKGIEFKEAVAMVNPLAGVVPFDPPVARVDDEPDSREAMTYLWRRARPLDGLDLASRYLEARGIKPQSWPCALRFIEDLPYTEGKTRLILPAMLAKFVAPDSKSAILHRTWLQEPGQKADVEFPRKMFRGRIPCGGAVRLSPEDETMGVAEGIETALSAEAIARIPVWAACSAGELAKFKPPLVCKHLIIFGDNDASFTGQLASYSLARRLAVVPEPDRISIEVRLPLYWDRGQKDDWNDCLMGIRQRAPASEPKETA